MFVNLAQCAVLHAQTNSLQVCFPSIQLKFGETDTPSLSARACKFEGYNGYVFHPCCKEYPSPVTEDERKALKLYWHSQGWHNPDTWPHTVCHWAKLQLPNGQIACSVWHETTVESKLCRASCVEVSDSIFYISHYFINTAAQVIYDNKIDIANVLYFFCLHFGDVQYPLAMIELFSDPDGDVLSESSGTVYLCDPCKSITIFPITSIHSVVAMFPDMQVDPSGNISVTGKFSLMQHFYIKVVQFTGDHTFEDEEVNDD